MDKPRSVEILKTVQESEEIKRFFLDLYLDFKPGQFAMVWIPGVDEIPLSFVGGNPVEFIVQGIGEATGKMNSMREGDLLGVRGPYGEGFTLTNGKALLVGGGIGVAPLLALTDFLDEFDMVAGAKNEELLINFKELDPLIATDDGSKGFHGFATELVKEKIDLNSYDMVYSCGPEKMMAIILERCLNRGISCQFSFERYMKCGIGLCGACCVDPGGKRVCEEGPIFTGEELEGTEFGKYKRDASGRKKPIL